MSKFLIAGLGNPGEEYSFTRHNIGFLVADAFALSIQKEDAPASHKIFESGRHAWVCHGRFRGKSLLIVKPSTYMNLSGKAVQYWMNTENIKPENLLVITDDIALPFGTLRMKKKGSDGGHNGLNDIATTLNSTEYPRLRFGVGNDFPKGQQSEYVLGKWNKEEEKLLPERIESAVEMIRSYLISGIDRTMSAFNNK